MDFNLIWKAALVVFAGTFLLRFAGRKTISQMTLAETVLMVGIGSLLVRPITGKNIWVTFIVGAAMVVTLIAMEYGQLKFDRLEKLITGRSKILIENGEVKEKTLEKMKMTVDQLEMILRQQKVSNIGHVQWATLEPNGQLGLALKEEYRPVTKKEFQRLEQSINQLLSAPAQVQQLSARINELSQMLNKPNIFTEVKNKGHQKNPPADHLH